MANLLSKWLNEKLVYLLICVVGKVGDAVIPQDSKIPKTKSGEKCTKTPGSASSMDISEKTKGSFQSDPTAFPLCARLTFCQNGLLKNCGAMVTIQRSPTLHGQNESRDIIALPTNRDPSATWHTPGGGCVPPEPCRTMPAQFHNQGLAAALSPCVLQPYFNP